MNSSDPENAPEVPAGEDSAAPGPLLVPRSQAEAAPSDLPELGAAPQISPPPRRPSAQDFGSPLTWADLGYLLVFYLIAGYLLTLAVATVAASVAHTATGDILENLDGPYASLAVVIQALLSFATIGFLFALVRVRTGAPFWPAVGWRKFRGVASWAAVATRYAFLGCGLALLVSFASNLVDNGKTLPIEEFFHNRQTVVLLILLGVLVAPFVEETLFRGCIYPVVAGRFGVPAGVIVTGVLFGLAHAPQLRGGEGQIALLMCVGIVLTYIRARAETVLASYCVHVAYNSCLFAALIFSTGGLRHLPTT